MSDEDGHISVPKAHLGAPLFPLPLASIPCTLCPQYSAVRVRDSALTVHLVLRAPVKPEAWGGWLYAHFSNPHSNIHCACCRLPVSLLLFQHHKRRISILFQVPKQCLTLRR